MWEKAVLSVYKDLLPKEAKKVNAPLLREDGLLPGSQAAIERMREYASQGLVLENGMLDKNAFDGEDEECE